MDKKDMMPAVVLSSHVVGLGVIRALGSKGVPITAVSYQRHDMGNASKYVTDTLQVPHPEKDESGFIHALLESGEKAFSAAINPEKIYRASYDHEVRDLLNQAEICICDGVGAALAVRVLHGKQIGRITGVALFFELIKAAADKQWKVFLLGAGPDVNEGATQKLQEDYPSLQIVGRQDGYFQDSNKVVADINASGAQLVFVAMGSPKQEIWIYAAFE